MTHHLLHIDSSIRGEHSISRRLSARAAGRWLAAHPAGTVTYRDLGAHPLPHLDDDGGLARHVAPAQHTPAQAASWALTSQLIDEVKRADTILLGLPVYNFGAPSTVKAWVDHLVAPGLSLDPATHEGLLGGRELIVLAARGGGYAPGTPREGWDHAEQWLPPARRPFEGRGPTSSQSRRLGHRRVLGAAGRCRPARSWRPWAADGRPRARRSAGRR
jgi:FMN-dependent NADH-azoreductase